MTTPTMLQISSRTLEQIRDNLLERCGKRCNAEFNPCYEHELADSIDCTIKLYATIPTPGHHWPEQGGVYIGIAPAEAGLPMRHVVALDVTPPAEVMTWREAMAWAATLGNGARLPTRIEAIMAYQNARDAFERDGWYWTSTQSSRNFAFVQAFEGGSSYWGYKDHQRRVRAFRGLTLDTLTPLPGDAIAAPAGANSGEVSQ